MIKSIDLADHLTTGLCWPQIGLLQSGIQTPIWITDHLTTGHKYTIWILDKSGNPNVTVSDSEFLLSSYQCNKCARFGKLIFHFWILLLNSIWEHYIFSKAWITSTVLLQCRRSRLKSKQKSKKRSKKRSQSESDSKSFFLTTIAVVESWVFLIRDLG